MIRRLPLLALMLLGCNQENVFTQLEKVDTFQQKRKNTFDLLLVVDNSCSMIEEQKKLATNFNNFIQYFDGTDVDWQLGVVTTDVEDPDFSGHLVGGDDEIVLTNADGNEVERVAYTHDWAVTEGEALALDPTWTNTVSDDSLTHWCQAGTGSPGEVNPACGSGDGPGPNSLHGDVVITEFMADPAGVDDALGEWVELSNIGDADVDLSGWHLRDDGRNDFTIPDGTTIALGGTLVLARSTDPALNGDVVADVAVGEDFSLNNDVMFLTATTPGPEEIFAEMVSQGTSGSGIEEGLEAVRLATSPALADYNAGFVREEANFNVMVVSDEQDSSPDPVDTYLQDFAKLKGDAAFRDHSIMSVSAVVGMDPPKYDGEASCETINGAAVYGSRYVDAVSQTGGLIDSICDEDFSPIVSDLGLTLSGLQAEFELSHYPDLDSLEVALYSSADADSKIRDLTLDTDYTYVEERNSILFELDQVPESEQYIQAVYKVRSGG